MTTTESGISAEEKSPSQELVEYKNRLEAENRDLRMQVMSSHLEAVGLSPEKGLGKAIAKEYKGDLTPQAIGEYASSEYGHTFEAPDNPQVAAVEEAQQQVEQIQAVSQPIVPATEEDRIAELQQQLETDDATRQTAQATMNAKLGQFIQDNYQP